MSPNANLCFCNFGFFLSYMFLLTLWANADATDDSLDAVDGHFCPYIHPQMQYCTSDFVIRAELRKIIFEKFSNLTGEHERKMKFKVTKVYKAPYNPWPPRPLIRIHVYDIPLKVDQEYLLAGSGQDYLHVHRCNWVAPWNNVTRMQYRGLETRYYDNCRCMIYNKCLTADGQNLCSEWKADKRDKVSEWDRTVKEEKKNPFSCPTDMFKNSKSLLHCYNEHAACYLTSSEQSCRWRTDDEYYTYCVNKDWLRKFN